MDNLKYQQDDSVDSTPLSLVCGSTSCGWCASWEVRVKSMNGLPNLGHCQTFDKLKWYYEGDNCTEFNSPKLEK